MEKKDKGYWSKDGYFYEKGSILCGICSKNLGKSSKKEGELSYCGCEEDHYGEY